jgi:type I restriction enzyme S subunit
VKWPTVKLGEICTTTSGGTPSRLRLDFFDGDVPWVKSGDLNDGIVTSVSESITETGLSSSNAKVFRPGTLLIAMYGATVGKLGLLGIPAATNQAVCAIVPRYDVEIWFLFYFLLSIRARLVEQSTGGAQPNISQRIVRDLVLPLPPVAEQRRILEILDRAAAIQRLRRAAVEKAREIIPALFLDMFGDPAANPKGWPRASIGAAVLACDYGSSTKASTEPVGTPMLRMGNVTSDGELDLSDLKYVALPANEQRKYALHPGDILFNRTNSRELVGKTGIWRRPDSAVYASYFIRLRTDIQRVLPEYLWAFLNTPTIKARLFTMARGAIGQSNINSKELKAIELPIPDISVQQWFRQCVASLLAAGDLHTRASEAANNAAAAIANQLLSEGRTA